MSETMINEVQAAIILMQMATGLTANQVIEEYKVDTSSSSSASSTSSASSSPVHYHKEQTVIRMNFRRHLLPEFENAYRLAARPRQPSVTKVTDEDVSNEEPSPKRRRLTRKTNQDNSKEEKMSPPYQSRRRSTRRNSKLPARYNDHAMY